MRRWLDHPRARLVAVAVLALLLIITGMQMYRRANRPGGYDFTSYLLSARALAEGSNPYATETEFPYIYPLTLATLLIPLAYLPYALANVLWFLLNVAALWTALSLMERTATRIAKIPSTRCRLPVITLMLLLTFNSLQNHFLNGQVNLIVLLAVLLFQSAAVRDQHLRAGLALAFAIALKLMPGLLLLPLALRRNWRTLIYTLLATAALVLLPYLWLGTKLWSFYADYFDTFWIDRVLISTQAMEPRVSYSLGAIFAMIGGSPQILRIIGMLVVLGLLLWIEIRERGELPERLPIYLLGMLLISPMSETHHLVFVLPSLTLLGLWLYTGERALPRRLPLLFVLALAALVGGEIGKIGPLICLALLLFGITQWRALRPNAMNH